MQLTHCSIDASNPRPSQAPQQGAPLTEECRCGGLSAHKWPSLLWGLLLHAALDRKWNLAFFCLASRSSFSWRVFGLKLFLKSTKMFFRIWMALNKEMKNKLLKKYLQDKLDCRLVHWLWYWSSHGDGNVQGWPHPSPPKAHVEHNCTQIRVRDFFGFCGGFVVSRNTHHPSLDSSKVD